MDQTLRWKTYKATQMIKQQETRQKKRIEAQHELEVRNTQKLERFNIIKFNVGSEDIEII